MYSVFPNFSSEKDTLQSSCGSMYRNLSKSKLHNFTGLRSLRTQARGLLRRQYLQQGRSLVPLMSADCDENFSSRTEVQTP